jgi:hypothetical protein
MTIIMAKHEDILRHVDRRRRQPPAPPPPPPPGFEPAEGVAALRARADFILAPNAQRREAAQARQPRHGPDWGAMHNARWQQAVREQQRLAGIDAREANDVVTSTVNHLGYLQEKAPWFTADARLREAPIDETLRHAMPGGAVPSEPAQQAWSRYFNRPRPTGYEPDADAIRATHESASALHANWQAAWEAWRLSA